MSGAYSSDAMRGCYDTVKAAVSSAQLGGIYANKPGYHNCRAQLPSSDYSVQRSQDKQGDAWAAGALDITLGDADMKRMTQRLIDATKAGEANGRLRAVREFFGTVNGYSVTGMDVPGGYWVTSDDSHLWHIHLSSNRSHANDKAAWQDVAAVLLGGAGGATPEPEPEDDDVKYNSFAHNEVHPLPAGVWSTLYVDDDNSQSFVVGPAHFWATVELNLTGVAKGSAVHVRFYQIDTKDGATSKRVTTYPQIEILGTSGGSAGKSVQLGYLGAPAKGWTRRLRCEASPDGDGVSYEACYARSFYY